MLTRSGDVIAFALRCRSVSRGPLYIPDMWLRRTKLLSPRDSNTRVVGTAWVVDSIVVVAAAFIVP